MALQCCLRKDSLLQARLVRISCEFIGAMTGPLLPVCLQFTQYSLQLIPPQRPFTLAREQK
jgi:hypothetical protein